MRKIQFRGKTINNPTWVYGGIIPPDDTKTTYTIIQDGTPYTVFPESVGQLIEIKIWNEDDESKCQDHIYENDIIRTLTVYELYDHLLSDDYEKKPKLQAYRVGFRKSSPVLFNKNNEVVEQWSDGEVTLYEMSTSNWDEIIGNYFDNPELLKK